ncbi:lytic transglycosylase domain-containing protein [Caballeronia sp. LZ062]|uniref:lytic transglycosylase domain-containing protein n=1 Tax=unclassified Caballeronia TaxID=2646786 RepID=UPI00285C0E4B|nr:MULTISPECIES: lytic transglycosylase domain-containing protein [unclassified Caballeronia]MDR5871596.1 lytic transglycosylase domain-containing protein [Caballeronia sp. LZ062]
MEAQKRPHLNDLLETARRMMRAWLFACALCTCHAHAHAANMLRCESDDNNRVSYVSERIEHARCSRLTMNWRESASSIASASSAIASAPAMPRPVALRRRQATARIYSYMEDGVRHYLTRNPDGVAASVSVIELHFIETCNLCEPAAEVNVAALSLDTRSYQREIDAAAASFGVDRALVRAVIHAESGYRADAVSGKGAQGLMQLMPATAARFDVGDPFDAAQNIRGGVRYLAWLLRRFGGDLDLTLAAYNSGEGAVARHDGVPPYAETQAYVSRVKLLADRYRAVR